MGRVPVSAGAGVAHRAAEHAVGQLEPAVPKGQQPVLLALREPGKWRECHHRQREAGGKLRHDDCGAQGTGTVLDEKAVVTERSALNEIGSGKHNAKAVPQCSCVLPKSRRRPQTLLRGRHRSDIAPKTGCQCAATRKHDDATLQHGRSARRHTGADMEEGMTQRCRAAKHAGMYVGCGRPA